jgi:hypothetical protein
VEARATKTIAGWSTPIEMSTDQARRELLLSSWCTRLQKLACVGHRSAYRIVRLDSPDTALMKHIRLLSDSCDVWRSGYSHYRGLLLQSKHWVGKQLSVWDTFY